MKEDQSIESRIQQAMRSRAQHFRDQADSLTFEGVRRLLEKDLVLDTYALDLHKRFVKQLLEKYLSGREEEEDDVNDDESKGSEHVIKLEEEVVVKEAKIENSESQGDTKEKIPTDDMIKEAIWNKATYFRAKSEELTLAGVRRLLEEDLELKKFSLDSFKKVISKQLDEVLNSQSNKDADSSPSHSERSDNIQVEVKPKKKGKVQKPQEPKKRRKIAQETERPRKKKMKHAEETSVEKNNVDDQSSDEKSVKKEMVAPVYGKKVERLKSIIKACGMTVAPTVYKKAKQAPEDKRESFLIKELQELLSKEGLSANPSEKEMKEVKRRKERAKELEGIDTSNIVLGSRRRSTTFPPPKPEEPRIQSDDNDSNSSDNEEDDGSDDQVEDEDNVHATQSEEEVHEETFHSD